MWGLPQEARKDRSFAVVYCYAAPEHVNSNTKETIMLRLAQRGDRLRIAILMVADTAIATAVGGSAACGRPG